MAFSDDAVLEVTLIGEYQLQENVAVFNYRVELGTAPVTTSPILLAEKVIDDLIPAILDVQSNAFSWQQVKIRGVVDDTSEYDTSFAAMSGSASGEGMPPFVCFTFKYQRATTNTRHGWKRFGGVPEVAQAGGVVTPTFLPGLNTLAERLYDSLIDDTGEDNSFIPVILSLVESGVPRVDPYVNEVNDIIYTHIGSQNTRKFGRGS